MELASQVLNSANFHSPICGEMTKEDAMNEILAISE